MSFFRNKIFQVQFCTDLNMFVPANQRLKKGDNDTLGTSVLVYYIQLYVHNITFPVLRPHFSMGHIDVKGTKKFEKFIQFFSRYCFAMSNKTSISTEFHITTMNLYFQSWYPHTVQTHSKLFSVSELLTEWNRWSLIPLAHTAWSLYIHQIIFLSKYS